jgi:hypothetical protein
MTLTLLDYQVLPLIALICIAVVYAYSVGLKEGKRIGYHRGRSINFNQYKEDHK